MTQEVGTMMDGAAMVGVMLIPVLAAIGVLALIVLGVILLTRSLVSGKGEGQPANPSGVGGDGR